MSAFNYKKTLMNLDFGRGRLDSPHFLKSKQKRHMDEPEKFDRCTGFHCTSVCDPRKLSQNIYTSEYVSWNRHKLQTYENVFDWKSWNRHILYTCRDLFNRKSWNQHKLIDTIICLIYNPETITKYTNNALFDLKSWNHNKLHKYNDPVDLISWKKK